jgi:hypothetical protein
VGASAATGSNTKLFKVSGKEGTQLMLLNPQTYYGAGGQLQLINTSGEPTALRGAQFCSSADAWQLCARNCSVAPQ